MDIKLNDFCLALRELKLSAARQALAILWFDDRTNPDKGLSAGWVSKVIFESGLGNPNSTALGKAVRQTGLAIVTGTNMRLKHAARAEVRGWLEPILSGVAPSIDQTSGFLPADIWRNTRPYVESVCEQLNGCIQFGFYDAASVMLRRLVETLIIEAFEGQGRQHVIRDATGNYLMLGGLVEKTLGAAGLNLGRDAKGALKQVKALGDHAAHNRRYRAVKADLSEPRSVIRVLVQELIQEAGLQKSV